jgi:hypothetical protein
MYPALLLLMRTPRLVSGFCACAITFQTQSTTAKRDTKHDLGPLQLEQPEVQYEESRQPCSHTGYINTL